MPDPTVIEVQPVIARNEALPTKAVIAITVISLLCIMMTVACIVCVVLCMCGHSHRSHIVKGPDVVKPLYARLPPSGEEYVIPIDRKWEFQRGK